MRIHTAPASRAQAEGGSHLQLIIIIDNNPSHLDDSTVNWKMRFFPPLSRAPPFLSPLCIFWRYDSTYSLWIVLIYGIFLFLLWLIWFYGVILEAFASPGISCSSILTLCLYMYPFSFFITKHDSENLGAGAVTRWHNDSKNFAWSRWAILSSAWRVFDEPGQGVFLHNSSGCFMADGTAGGSATTGLHCFIPALLTQAPAFVPYFFLQQRQQKSIEENHSADNYTLLYGGMCL